MYIVSSSAEYAREQRYIGRLCGELGSREPGSMWDCEEMLQPWVFGVRLVFQRSILSLVFR